MKKKLKYCFFMLIYMVFMIGSIYGYNLKIQADVNSSDDYIYFYTIVKASQNSINDFGNSTPGKWKDMPSNSTTNSSSYGITGIIFHREPLSEYKSTNKMPITTEKVEEEINFASKTDGLERKLKVDYSYSNWASNENYNVAYVDSYNKDISLIGNIEEDRPKINDYINYSDGDFYEIKPKNITLEESEIVKNNGKEVGVYYKFTNGSRIGAEYTIITIGNEKSVVYKYAIGKDIIDSKKIKDYFFKDDGTTREIYISFVTKSGETPLMYTAADFYSNIFNPAKSMTIKNMVSSNQKIALAKDARQRSEEATKTANNYQEQANAATNSTQKDQLTGLANLYKNEARLYSELATAYEEETKSVIMPSAGTLYHPYTKGVDYSNNPQRGWSAANDYDNILVIKENKKTIYVDYVEEVGNSFSVLKIAPKENKLNSSDKGIHEYTLNESSWFDLFKYYENTSTNREIYEQYDIDIEDNVQQKKVKLIRMAEEEVNKKLGTETENDEGVQPYKYDRLNYLLGSSGDNYESLSKKIYNNNPNKNKDAINISVNKNNAKPILVSFVYKSSNKQNLIVQVEHNAKSKGVLPIADYANTVLNGEKTSNSNETLAEYKVNAKHKNSNVQNLETGTYTMSDGTDATYTNEYKVEFFKSNSTKAVYTKKYKGSLYSFNPNDLVYNSAYTRIKVTFYYDVKNSITEITSFNPCITLGFTSTLLTGTKNCEEGTKGKINESCCEGMEPEAIELMKKNNTSYITIPTNERYYGVLSTPIYSVAGIKYMVSISEGTSSNIIEKKEWSVGSDGKHDICVRYGNVPVKDEDGNIQKDSNGYVKTESVCVETKETTHMVTKGNPSKIETNPEYNNMRKKWNKRISNGTRHLGGIQSVIYLGRYKKCDYGTCSCGVQYKISEEKGDFYKVRYIAFNLIEFTGRYLTKAEVINYNNDSTKFIGNGKDTATSETLSIDTGESYSLLESTINNLNSTIMPTYCDGTWQDIEIKIRGQEVVYKACSENGLTSKYGYTDVLYGQREISAVGGYRTEDIISKEKYNGERMSIAQVTYYNYDRKHNLDTSKYDRLGPYSDYIEKDSIKSLIESEQKNNESKNDINNEDEDSCTDISTSTPRIPTVSYEHKIATKQAIGYSNTSGVHIANSVTLDNPMFENTSDRIISQTLGSASSFTLQQGVETKITPKLAALDSLYGNKLTPDKRKEYIKCYVYYFTFPAIVDGKKYEANTPIFKYVSGVDKVIAGNSAYLDNRGAINFTPIGYEENGTTTSSVNYREDSIVVMALTINVPTSEINLFVNKAYESYEKYQKPTGKYYGISEVCEEPVPGPDDTTRNNFSSVLKSYGKSIRNDAYYVSNIIKVTTSNISRVYDLQITDCTDVNYKNVFRKNTNSSVIEHTGITYKSGIRALDVFTNRHNEIQDKENTLPLGPYKQTGGYVDAPKIGYRISFDLKTSGYYDYSGTNGQKRTVVIFPKLYYISKDGNKFIENVNAYYKNSSGKYEKINQIDVSNMDEVSLKNLYIEYAKGNKTAGGYKISYIPNDGYRNVTSIGITQLTDMFTKEKTELDTSSIILTKKNMCTNNLKFIQTWYGEYKLPNSTILVEKGETNLNNYLKDGYCGVIFYIGVVEEGNGYDTVVISYNHSDKKRSDRTNTTQWDYEGFLGYPQSQIGSKLQGTLRLQLAKGIWNIDNDLYQKVKGTVLLYDLDNRAASDFE